MRVSTRGDHLDLSEALGVAEDLRVSHRDDIGWRLEVLRKDDHLAQLLLDLIVSQIHPVDPVQHLDHPSHRVVESQIDRRDDLHALFDQRQRRANRHIRSARLSQLLEGRAHDALGFLRHQAQQL